MADDGTPDGRGRRVEMEPPAELSLDGALKILGEETRAAILTELGAAQADDGVTPEVLGFSELMARVGAEDSGRFNYHLDKLVGTFVMKTEEGYVLRMPGRRVYQAMVAGTLADRRAVDPFDAGDCTACGDRLTAAYHPDHLLTVECEGCDRLVDALHFPVRGVADRSTEALLDAAYQRRHAKLDAMRRGVCFACGAAVARSLRRAPPPALAGPCGGDVDAFAVLSCEACNASLAGDPANVALAAPPVVGFFADHDRDAALTRWWDEPVATARERAAVDAEDGLTVTIPFELGDERLRVVLDETLQVATADRTEG